MLAVDLPVTSVLTVVGGSIYHISRLVFTFFACKNCIFDYKTGIIKAASVGQLTVSRNTSKFIYQQVYHQIQGFFYLIIKGGST